MKKYIVGAVAALALATAGVIAQTGGGFPYRPKFGAIGVNATVPPNGLINIQQSSGGIAQVALKNSSAATAFGLCFSDTAAQCGVGQGAGDADLFANGTLHIGPISGAAASDYMRLTGSNTGFLGPNPTNNLSWNSAGDYTLAAPTSGTALSMSAVSGATALAITTSSSAAGISITNGAGILYNPTLIPGLVLNSSGADVTSFQNDASNTWSIAYGTNTITNNTPVFQWNATPQLLGRGPVAAALVDMTPDKGSWTTTVSGPWIAGNNVTTTAKWERQGSQVTVWIDTSGTQTATSAATIALSALPAAITPSSNRVVPCFEVEDNGSTIQGFAFVNTTNTIGIQRACVSGTSIAGCSFSGAGATGVLATWSITYSL